MTSKLTIEQAKRLRNDFECWQQDYDPKDDKEQYDMFGRGMVAMDMLIAGMYQEPVAYTDERNWAISTEGGRRRIYGASRILRLQTLRSIATRSQRR